jgi:hypothetical protein
LSTQFSTQKIVGWFNIFTEHLRHLEQTAKYGYLTKKKYAKECRHGSGVPLRQSLLVYLLLVDVESNPDMSLNVLDV